MVVDDEPDVQDLIQQKFRKKVQSKEYHFYFALNGKEALKQLDQLDVDIILSDINMPEMDGLTLLKEVEELFPFVKVIIISAYGDISNIRTAMNRNAFDFLTKPIDFEDLEITIQKTMRHINQVRKTNEQLEYSLTKLQRAIDKTIETISVIGEIRDPYTAGHQRRVANLAKRIATELQLDEEVIQSIYISSVVHDIGKIYVPSEILSKPGRLSKNEFELIKQHSQVGYDIFQSIEFPWPMADIILMHHEKLDGSGYPKGLTTNDILFESKIISVADVVEAISSYRPYRPALGMEVALEEIKNKRGIHFDPDVVDICTYLIKEKKFQF